jgi:hypothetical protein
VSPFAPLGLLPRTGERARRLASTRPALAATLGYLILVMALFREIVFQGRVLFERDIHLFWYTQVESFVRIVTTPAWPLWDPYTSFGQPLLADPSAQVLYPLTWMNLLMRPWVYYTLLVVSHLTLSGLGAFRLGRALGLTEGGAFTGGCLWILSGPYLSLVNVTHHFTGASWLPWVLFAAERAVHSRRVSAALVWGATMAGQIVAGSADMCALTWVVAAGLLLRRLDWRRWRANTAVIGSGLLAGVAAIGLSAALWWPALDVVQRSARRSLPEEVRQYWSTHPARLLEVVLPIPWRHLAVRPDLAREVYEDRDPFLHVLYLGLPALALVLAGLGHRRRGLVTLALAVMGGALLLALGRYTPAHGWLVTLVPPAGVIRYPQKAMVLFGAVFALLAGLGFDAWPEAHEHRVRWRLGVVLPLAALTAVVWLGLAGLTAAPGEVERAVVGTAVPDSDRPRVLAIMASRLLPSAVALTLATLLGALALRPRWSGRVAWLVALVAVADLFFAHRDDNPTAHRDLFRSRPAVLAQLPQDDRSRLYVYDYLRLAGSSERHLGRKDPYLLARAPAGWTRLETSTLAMRDALVPPVAGTWGRESSFEIDFRGLYSEELAGLTLALDAAEGTPAHSRLLRIGAVRHVVALHTPGFEDLDLVASVPDLLVDPIRVLGVRDTLPRAYVASGIRVADGPDAVAVMVHPSFDARREIVLPAGRPQPPNPRLSAECTILHARPDGIDLAARLSQDGYVVLVDAFDPGWRASVDGRAAPVLRANLAFRAVPVPAGAHEISLRYRPTAVVAGLALSLATLVGCAGAALIGALRHRQRSPRATETDQSGEARAIQN